MNRNQRFLFIIVIVGLLGIPLSKSLAQKRAPLPEPRAAKKVFTSMSGTEVASQEESVEQATNAMAPEVTTDPALAVGEPLPAPEDAAAQEPLPSTFIMDFPQAISSKAEDRLTLEDCYALALKQSETVAMNAELIKIAQAHFLQSLGSLLPQVSFSWSDTHQNSNAGVNSVGRTHRLESRFIFKQTLFSGFKEIAGMSGSRLEKGQYQQEKKRAEQLLFVDVADAFYLLLQQQEDVQILADIRKSLLERIAELKKREDIGRSRHSEVVNTEVQLYNVEAEIEYSKSQELIARELLSFLTGQNITSLQDPEDTPNTLLAQVNYLAQVDSRPDVKAAQYAWDVAKKQSIIARSDLFPTVSIEGNTFPHRNDLPSDQSWSSVLKVDVPIFEGTTTYGAIKEANAQTRTSALQFQQTQRLAIQDVRDSYTRAQAAILRANAMDKALQAAELNYSLQTEDYKRSLVSNLDVLAAIQSLGNTRRTFIQTRYEKKRYYWQLQAAIGAVGQER